MVLNFDSNLHDECDKSEDERPNREYTLHDVGIKSTTAPHSEGEIKRTWEPGNVNRNNNASRNANGSVSNLHEWFILGQGTKTGAGENPERKETEAPFNSSLQKGPIASG